MTQLLIVGEAFGEQEETLGIPFVGPSGVLLIALLAESGILHLTETDKLHLQSYWNDRDSNYIALIWTAHPEIVTTNVFLFRPPGNDLAKICGSREEGCKGFPSLIPGKYLKAEYLPHVEALQARARDLKPNLILALGNVACWALLGRQGISKIRGATTASPFGKVLPAYHPAAILRQWELRPITVLDFRKAAREMASPEINRPKRKVYIPENLSDLETFYTQFIVPAEFLSVDVETAADQITCIGFAPSRSVAMCLPFHDPRKGGNYWATPEEEFLALKWAQKVLEGPTKKIFQNGIFDLHRIFRAYGIKVNNAAEDTMLMSHALQPESPKGLAYLASYLTDESPWKLEVRHSTIKKES